MSHGGRIIAEGEFPVRPTLGLTVSQGGAIDARQLKAEGVAAAVDSGGRIFTRPLGSLAASVEHGGHITYWGRPGVTKAIHGGGVVIPGEPSEEHMSLAELTPAPVPPPPLPPLPDMPNTAPPVPPD